ncbi:phosphate acyltransferase PlsX [Deferribacterales bacterium Es71-Z0220]|uniref:phosphate acyltransferase PlsX n=1 Tax=Deferrivibrio essentukiensis TaxID=2880922 RepID=UPI001F60080D|nr:phosphate acyltransferase PlsX [Deferrivibrio essentukiensis]MCB4204866.1 phosphate acyltransferase PlsX [Deferrivibrio essentukiensis]
MRIVVDAMGGDFAPTEVISGAVESIRQYGYNIVLVGDERLINKELSKYSKSDRDKIFVVHTEEAVTMEDSPSQVVRGKRNSSIHIALKMLKNGEASGFFSAGNTGAIMAISKLFLRTIEGVDRPAIGAVLPTMKGHTVMLDVGANVDCKPIHFLQFAIMGSAYAKIVLNIDDPTVKLLSIGEEDVKGNELTKSVFKLLQNSEGINFRGNVEGKEIFKGVCDVIVCDGFAGNIALKASESAAGYISKLLKEELTRNFVSKIGALLAKGAFDRIKKHADYTEYGGAPLLGVNGVVIIGHGSSNSNAVKNGIRVAHELAEQKLTAVIEKNIRDGYSAMKVDKGESFWNNIKEKLKKLNKTEDD